jgi:hypothetical protein
MRCCGATRIADANSAGTTRPSRSARPSASAVRAGNRGGCEERAAQRSTALRGGRHCGARVQQCCPPCARASLSYDGADRVTERTSRRRRSHASSGSASDGSATSSQKRARTAARGRLHPPEMHSAQRAAAHVRCTQAASNVTHGTRRQRVRTRQRSRRRTRSCAVTANVAPQHRFASWGAAQTAYALPVPCWLRAACHVASYSVRSGARLFRRF